MDNIYKNLFNLYTEFFKYEELLNKKSNYDYYEGYLIEKDKIEKLKRNIFYNILKPYIAQKNEFNAFINNKIVKHYLDKYKEREREKEKEYKINIINVKFQNGEELIKSINDNRKYYLINSSLWNKICKIQNRIINDKGIQFSFERNNIILYLNKNEKLYFKRNNGIIEKSNFTKSIYKKSAEIEENIEEDENTFNYNNTALYNQNFEFNLLIFNYIYFNSFIS